MMISDENIQVVRDCLQDDERTKLLLKYLSSDDATDRHHIVDKFSSKAKFAVVFDEWVRNQCRPFLGFKPVDDPATISAAASLTAQDIVTVNDVPKADSAALSLAKPKKTKKRVTPVTIAASLPPSLTATSANLAFGKSAKSKNVVTSVVSASEQWPALGATSTTKSSNEEWPSLGDSAVLKQGRKKEVSQKIATNTLPQSTANNSSVIEANITTPLTATAFTESTQCVVLPTNLAFASNSVVPTSRDARSALPAEETPICLQKINAGDLGVPLPIPTMSRNISTSVKAQLDSVGVTVRVFETPRRNSMSLSNDGLNRGTELLSSYTSASSSDRMTVANMARVYSTLVMERLLPVVPSFIFLSRLLTTRHTYKSLGKEILVELESDQKFPSCLLCDADVETFISGAASELVDVFASLGPDVSSTYADLVEGVNAQTAEAIRSAGKCTTAKHSTEDGVVEDDSILEGDDGSVGSVVRQANELTPAEGYEVDTFIRPFHEELDSRNEYRTQVHHRLAE